MNKKWGCWSQKIKGQCYMTQIGSLTDEIEKMRSYLQILENKEATLRRALQGSNFEELLKIDGTYLDAYAALPSEMEEVLFSKNNSLQEICPCTPHTCYGNFWYKNNLKEHLREELNEKINIYNKLLSVCLQLQYFYEHQLGGSIYNRYFLKLMEMDERIIVLCGEITQFVKGLPEKNEGKLYLFMNEMSTQIPPESYLAFRYEHGAMYIEHIQVAPLHRNFEAVLLSGIEEFANILSSYLSNKRYLPIATLRGQLGVEKYASRAILLKAYLKNNFTPHGKTYPDGTYLPYQEMLKQI